MFNIPYMPTYSGLCRAFIHGNSLNYGNDQLLDSIVPVLKLKKRNSRQARSLREQVAQPE